MVSLRRRMLLSKCVLAVLVVGAGGAIALAGAELAAKGGKIKIQHGTPPWKEEFESQLKAGLNWRLGSDAATTLNADAGMIFSDFVAFPGEYNLALTSDKQDEYKVVFHHDGQFYTNKKTEGAAAFDARKVEGKQVTKALVIELVKNPAGPAQGVISRAYVFRITFGPHRLESTFDTAKAKTAKGKAGSKPYTLTYLERTDIGALDQQLEKGEVCVGRIDRKDAEPARVYLTGGETPRLRIAAGVSLTGAGSVTGKKETVKTPAPAVAVSMSDAGDGSKATFSIGGSNYVFEIPAKTFGDAPTPRGN